MFFDGENWQEKSVVDQILLEEMGNLRSQKTCILKHLCLAVFLQSEEFLLINWLKDLRYQESALKKPLSINRKIS
jgi:hypothetical protein